jgi:hypothetical protein
VICGLNRVRVKAAGREILSARPIRHTARGLRLAGAGFPLLVVDRDPAKRRAALTTDLAPHWAGGLVDWGAARVRLSVTRGIAVEVGTAYARFVRGLLAWAAGGR